MFNERQQNSHDEERRGCLSFVNDGLVHNVNERVRDDRRFTISDLSLHFPQISRNLLYDIVSSHMINVHYLQICLSPPESSCIHL